jgi:hypothetical protein
VSTILAISALVTTLTGTLMPQPVIAAWMVIV